MSSQKQIINAVVIGPSGQGKSTLIQSIINQKLTIPLKSAHQKIATFSKGPVEINLAELDSKSKSPFKPSLCIFCYNPSLTNTATLLATWSPALSSFKGIVLMVGSIQNGENMPIQHQIPENLIGNTERHLKVNLTNLAHIQGLIQTICMAALTPRCILLHGNELSPKCKKACAFVFKQLDHDTDGILSGEELAPWNRLCFSEPMKPAQLDMMKQKIAQVFSPPPETPYFRGQSLDFTQWGFSALNLFLILNQKSNLVWTVFKHYGIDTRLSIPKKKMKIKTVDSAVSKTESPVDLSNNSQNKTHVTYKTARSLLPQVVLNYKPSAFSSILAKNTSQNKKVTWEFLPQGIQAIDSIFNFLDKDTDGQLSIKDLVSMFYFASYSYWQMKMVHFWSVDAKGFMHQFSKKKSPTVKQCPGQLDYKSIGTFNAETFDYTETWLPWAHPLHCLWMTCLTPQDIVGNSNYDLCDQLPAMNKAQFRALWISALALNPTSALSGLWSLHAFSLPKNKPSNSFSSNNITLTSTTTSESLKLLFSISESLKSCIHQTYADREDPIDQTQSVFQIFVMGERKSGKTTLCRSQLATDDSILRMIGKSAVEESNVETSLSKIPFIPKVLNKSQLFDVSFPHYTVKTMLVQKDLEDEDTDTPLSPITIILREMHGNPVDILGNAELFSQCDCVLFAYDSNDPNSFKPVSNVLHHPAIEAAQIPVLYLSTKVDLGIIPFQDTPIQPTAVCKNFKIADPIKLSLVSGVTNDLYQSLASLIFCPSLSQPVYSTRKKIVSSSDDYDYEDEEEEDDGVETSRTRVIAIFFSVMVIAAAGTGYFMFKKLSSSTLKK